LRVVRGAKEKRRIIEGRQSAESRIARGVPRGSGKGGGRNADVDDCIGIGEERDSARRAHADGSRERISKVCSQLIIGTRPPSPSPPPPGPVPARSSCPAHRGAG